MFVSFGVHYNGHVCLAWLFTFEASSVNMMCMAPMNENIISPWMSNFLSRWRNSTFLIHTCLFSPEPKGGSLYLLGHFTNTLPCIMREET